MKMDKFNAAVIPFFHHCIGNAPRRIGLANAWSPLKNDILFMLQK